MRTFSSLHVGGKVSAFSLVVILFLRIVLFVHRLAVEIFPSFSGRISNSAFLFHTGAQTKDVVFGLGAHTVTATLFGFSIRIVT